MNIKQYLDSTYLKTAEQAGATEQENCLIAKKFIEEAIKENFKLIMIRPDRVIMAKKMIQEANSVVGVGTVIDFPEGKSSIGNKLKEAAKAIKDGVDDLDFVCNYHAFKNGETDLVKEEILKGTALGLANNKVVKWIIEVAALNEKEIVQLSSLIKNTVVSNFDQESYSKVFVKSSTGFYKTENNYPNGATISAIKIMLDNAAPLSVKAAGGVRTYDEAVAMIELGVKRIGTSGAKVIANGQYLIDGY
ncbi:deoxyribose-phosphate aldolase [Flavobacterium segetis]|uniref:Deoxyribose-phosphate aldolase n=1 Tax=Flavobacterium segetis TaxID=271157 RepID=A0A1M5EYZ7_9FLAO|nr:deoxyribose-phosphate aldolase [Flavobacterium segetis]SHF84540.1 deoxyribose-phosphate aldolase [Flavobacterium segetis]